MGFVRNEMGFNGSVRIFRKRVMEDRSRTGLHDFTRASRKAEESGLSVHL